MYAFLPVSFNFLVQIAHYKIPKYFLFKEETEFPLTVTNKVKKYEMRSISIKELGLEQVKSHLDRIASAYVKPVLR